MDISARWNEEKNQALIARYGIRFEDILAALEAGRFLDDREHPNLADYPHQRQLIVAIEGYAYVVPYVIEEQRIFFKTLFPGRKCTRDYLTDPKS